MSSTWFALLAPAGTPKPIIDRMNTEVNEILADQAFKKKLADIGATPMGGSPVELANHLAAELEKWGVVIRAAGIKNQ